MREEQSVNLGWKFSPRFSESDIAGTFGDFLGEVVDIPHTVRETPFNYFDEKMTQFISCYKYEYDYAPDARRVFLRFEGVLTACKLYINGVFAEECQLGYLGFTPEITSFLRPGKNTFTVVVDSRELANIPPFGGQIDYLTYGGIYRDVTVLKTDERFIRNAFVSVDGISGGVDFHVRALLDGDGAVSVRIEQEGRVLYEGRKNSEKGEAVISFSGCKLQLWDTENPQRYLVRVQFNEDEISFNYGFRTCAFRPDGFYLNGKRVNLLGLDRHQSYPHVGYAMPAGPQRRDAEILKWELGCNIVRTSHYPQSRHFLQRCDEIGLLVFEEIPGWQHIGDEAWQEISVRYVRGMIERDYNYACVVLWGVRINESMDSDDFYRRTNAAARELDVTRATGGVRCIERSKLLEDVYTYNDFVHTGANRYTRPQREVTGLDCDVPYLITEFMGHMYPTKRTDCEERQVEQAVRHMRIQADAGADGTKCGAIGWCMADYNTHKQFGSGDRVCYHGVLDMFRLPKFAAKFYRSQVSPEREIVLEPATYWTQGERSGGGVTPLYVFTNCDYITFRIADGKPVRYDRIALPGLAYPPILIESMEGVWGEQWNDAVFVGYRNGKVVAERRMLANPQPAGLKVEADSEALARNDAVRVTVSVVDAAGNPLPYYTAPLRVQTDARLIGEAEGVLLGGRAAFWVRANSDAPIHIRVLCGGWAEELSLRVIEE